MDFDGSTRKRTVVSLRGKSKEEDAKELLRRARAEREARAAEKRRTAAAATVLRFHRRRYVGLIVPQSHLGRHRLTQSRIPVPPRQDGLGPAPGRPARGLRSQGV